MRVVLIVALAALPCIAQDMSPAPRNRLSGHTLSGFDDDAPQISIEVMFVTASEDAYRRLQSEALIRSAPTDDQLTVPSVTDSELSASGGIRLVAATTVVEEQRPIFVETINDTEKKQLIQSFEEDPTSNLMFAPKSHCLKASWQKSKTRRPDLLSRV